MTNSDRTLDTHERMEKLAKKVLPPEVVTELTEMTTDQLKQRIVLCHANLAENDRERETDENLADAKAAYTTAAAPYKEAKSLQHGMATYCTLLLELKAR